MAEGRGRAGIQGKARVAIPAWVPAHAVGVDFCESLWYPVVCLGVHGIGLLGDVDSGAVKVALVSFCVAGVSIEREFWAVKWVEMWGIPDRILWGMT